MSMLWFTSDKFTPPALLRRTDHVDEAFVGGVWQPTAAITDWMFGNDDFVTPISEAEARKFNPAAFTEPS